MGVRAALSMGPTHHVAACSRDVAAGAAYGCRALARAHVSCMYMNGTHQDTIKIHAGYIKTYQGICVPKHEKKPPRSPRPRVPPYLSVLASPTRCF